MTLKLSNFQKWGINAFCTAAILINSPYFFMFNGWNDFNLSKSNNLGFSHLITSIFSKKSIQTTKKTLKIVYKDTI